MTEARTQADIDATFDAAEQAGLKLAIRGRLIALLLVGSWLVLSRGVDRAADIILAVLVLAALGVLHYLVIGSAWDRKWVKYVFVSVDIALLSLAVALLPPEPTAQLPQIFMFKFDIFPYYFIVLGVTAFSFSPGLVLWSGVSGACGWLSAFFWVRSSMVAPLDWGDMPGNPTKEQFVDVFSNENFVGSGSRIQEALVYLVVAILIAVVMQRARQTVRRQLEAERSTALVAQIFGRFVPEAVATSMIEDKGAPDPVERQATVLYTDITGFTQLTEAKGPRTTVDILNAYFDAATEIIGRHNGVVTQFHGDAILAIFNVPLEDKDHAQSAFNAATELLAAVRQDSFAGERLQIRIGVNSGPLIAGNVGGGGRQSYTVYGDTVNLAARLEALNKEHGTALLVSHSTATLLTRADLKKIGETEIRGLSEPVDIYAPTGD